MGKGAIRMACSMMWLMQKSSYGLNRAMLKKVG